jgi:hypothetical protein
VYAIGNQVGIDENSRADDAAHHGHRRAKEAKLAREPAALLRLLARIFAICH